MKYKVEYYTDTGTPSDNEFIGIYSTKEKAIIAKKRYINDQLGTLAEYTEDNGDLNRRSSIEEEYYEDVQRLENCVVIEPVRNRY